MRSILLVTVISLGVATSVLAQNTVRGAATGEAIAAGAASAAANNPVVMANTPDSGGYPNTIVCRAPQRIANSNQFGPEACGHNYEWQKLALNGKDLAPDGKTLIPRATVNNPKGYGDPDGVTCRTPLFAFMGPMCRTNRFWADYEPEQGVIRQPSTTSDESIFDHPPNGTMDSWSGGLSVDIPGSHLRQ